MYARLYEHLVLSTTTPEFSQAVNMSGFNAALVEIVTQVYGAAANIAVQVQMSNDLENWGNVPTGGTVTIAAIGYTTTVLATGIGGAYVRVKLTSGAAVTSILAVGINLSQL